MSRRTRRNWSAQEDAILEAEVEKALAEGRPLLWRELAKSVPGRSNKDCRKRWWNSLASDTVKGSWTESEDERLTGAVQQYGMNWSQVAQAVGSRTADQCSSHYISVLDPEINHCDWTPVEDENLLHAVLTYGTSWTRIAASHHPKRTPLTLKNRYAALRTKHSNNDRRHSRHSVSSSSVARPYHKSTSPIARRASQKAQKWQANGRIHEILGNEDDDDDGDDDDFSVADDRDTIDQELFTTRHSDSTYKQDQLPTDERRTNKNGNMVDQSRLVQPSQLMNGIGVMSNPAVESGAGPLSEQAWSQANLPSNQYKSPYTQSDVATVPRVQDYTNPFSGSNGLNGDIDIEPFPDDLMDFSIPTPESFAASHKPNGPSTFPSERPTTPPAPSQSASDSSSGSDQIRRAALTNYQVSINMTCTGAQLETVMAGLTNAGTSVNVKIDPKSA